MSTFVSSKSDGSSANDDSTEGRLSADGLKLLFQSRASDFVDDDTTDRSDIFVKNMITGQVTRVSTSADGNQANGNSYSAQFTPDADKVLFTSDASNLTPGGTAGSGIFLKDLTTGAITRIASGVAGPGVLSDDGTKVAFLSAASNLVAGDTNGATDLFVKDLVSGAVTRVSVAANATQGNGNVAGLPSFSADGTKVAFLSSASNLAAGDTNGTADIFVKDLVSGTITRVAIAPHEREYASQLGQPAISPDGSKIAFVREAVIATVSYPPGGAPSEVNTEITVYIKYLISGELNVLDNSFYIGRSSYFGAVAFSPDSKSIILPHYIKGVEDEARTVNYAIDITGNLPLQVVPGGGTTTSGGKTPATNFLLTERRSSIHLHFIVRPAMIQMRPTIFMFRRRPSPGHPL